MGSVRSVRGFAPPAECEPLLDELLAELRVTVFPGGEKRERQTIQAQGYIILRRQLEVCDGTPGDEVLPEHPQVHGMRPERPRQTVKAGKKLGWKQRTAAMKLSK